MSRKRLQKILTQVRDSFLEGDELPITPAQINNGWCADFATIVREKFGDGLNIVSDEDMGSCEYTHTFIEYKGLYYDCECIEGTEDWTDLPSFNRDWGCCEQCYRIVGEHETEDGRRLCEGCNKLLVPSKQESK